MAGTFDELVSIIGVTLAQRVIGRMGGKRVCIRKRLDKVRDLYLAAQMYYDAQPIGKGARELKCKTDTLRVLRRTLPKNYQP